MKKTLAKFLVVLSTFTLTACDLLSFGRFSNSESDSSTSSTTSSTTSSSSSSSSVTEKNVDYVSVVDNNTYKLGDKYSTSNIVVTVFYDDESSEIISSSKARFMSIKNPLGNEFSRLSRFERAGEYTATYRTTLNAEQYFSDVKFTIASGFETAGATLTSIEYETQPNFRKGEVAKDKLHNVKLLLHWNIGNEYYTYDIDTDTSGLSYSLKKDGDLVNDYLEEELVEGESYSLTLSYEGVTLLYEFSILGNYYRLDSNDIINIQTDVNRTISPSKGNVKMLVIPIKLTGSYTDNWTNNRLSQIDGYYFGTDTSKMSLKQYYETASFNQMNVSGTVTDPYEETSSYLTSDAIQSDTSYTKLFTLISNAVEYVRSNCPEINLDDYDLDDNGTIDNIHLITNFNSSTYQSETGESAWSTPLWPHKYQTNDSGTKTNPVANVYSISAINHVYDCVTAVHEQGHIFGLDDYYDYAQTAIDYVGCADMQSSNMFDWNSFSKFSVGWISPYVVTGPTELTVQAASINGDCIVVPANPDTFNNSAFDEYFLIELFAPYGNNAVNYPVKGSYKGSVWDYYSNSYDLGAYGVRLYHVNAQLYTYSGGFQELNTHTNNGAYLPTDNNAYNYSGRPYYFNDWADFKELAIIQRGGVDTFGDENANVRHYLDSTDLFHQGDVFTFNQYKHFLSKSGATVTSMNNGETFPYKITFTEMSSTQVTVKVEYV